MFILAACSGSWRRQWYTFHRFESRRDRTQHTGSILRGQRHQRIWVLLHGKKSGRESSNNPPLEDPKTLSSPASTTRSTAPYRCSRLFYNAPLPLHLTDSVRRLHRAARLRVCGLVPIVPNMATSHGKEWGRDQKSFHGPFAGKRHLLEWSDGGRGYGAQVDRLCCIHQPICILP